MKGNIKLTKKRKCIRPSPNEEAAIVQNEQERRKKIRLKQVREQEKAFALKVRKSIKSKRDNELKVLSDQLKEQWTEKQKAEVNNLEKKFQKTLDNLGDAHTGAIKEQDVAKKDNRILTKEDKQRAIERHNQAIYELSLEKARTHQAENDRAVARAKAMEAEKARAAMVASLPPTKDMILNFDLKEDQKFQPRSVEDFKSTRYHLQQPVIQVERMSKEQQIDARIAAIGEEDRIHKIREGIQRSEAEQAEKARLRHKHALTQLKIEEDRKKLMDDLSELERLDRQRRQDAVARIPVRIFQPPHKRVEDAEERQRDLEQAFEDMYMLQTGYTGDLTIALEPSTDPTPINEEHQLLVPDEQFEETPEPSTTSVPSSHGQEHPDESERESQKSEEITEKETDTQRLEEERKKESIPPKGEDAVKRLLLRIQRQREQGNKKKDEKTSGEKPSKQTPTSRATARVTGSRVNILTPLPEEEEELLRDEETPRTFPPKPHSATADYQDIPEDVPSDASQTTRTLLHPCEAAQQVRTIGAQRTEDEIPTSEPDEIRPVPELQEQQRLKLQLKEQRMIQERLEEQLKEYHKQFQKISSEIPKAPYAPREEPHPESAQSSEHYGSESTDEEVPNVPRGAPYVQGGQRTEHYGPESTDEEVPNLARGLPYVQETRRTEHYGPESTDKEDINLPREVPYVQDSFDQIKIPSKRISKKDFQKDQPLVSGHVISSDSSHESFTPSRDSGTISLEEQTPDEEATSESSKSEPCYGTLPGRPERGGQVDIKRQRDRFSLGVSSSEESNDFSSLDYNFQREAAFQQVRDQATGFLPLQWQRDSRVGSWKPSAYLPSRHQKYPSKPRSHETTEETVPAESSSNVGEVLESEDLTSSSETIDSISVTLRTSGVPQNRLLDLLGRNKVQSLRQTDSGIVPTLPLSSISSSADDTKQALISESSLKKIGGYESLPTSSSYLEEFKLTTDSPRAGTSGMQTVTPSSVVGKTTPSLSRVIDGSPNYLDEYRRKWEEEKKLIEDQRQLIRQKQDHQLRRMRYYQDILQRYEKESPNSLDEKPTITNQETEFLPLNAVTTNITTKTSTDETKSTTQVIHSRVSDISKLHTDSSQSKSTLHSRYDMTSMNKENDNLYANSVPRVPSLVGLKGSSTSSDINVFTQTTYPWDSSSSGRSTKQFILTQRHSKAPEDRKSTSTSDFSFPSSGTEYHSLPLSPEISGNFGPSNWSRSSITTLSELTEKMTKLTSSSENETGKVSPQGLEKVSDRRSWSEYLSENRVPEYDSSTLNKYKPPKTSTWSAGIETQMTGDTSSNRQWYVPAKSSTESLGSHDAIYEGGSPNASYLRDLSHGSYRGPGIQIPSKSINENGSRNERNLEDPSDESFIGLGIQVDAKSSIQPLGHLGPINEDLDGSLNARNLEDPSDESFTGPGIQVDAKSSIQPLGNLGPINEDLDVSPNARNLENLPLGAYRGPGMMFTPTSSNQAMGSPGHNKEITSNLEYQGPATQQWYLPPKSSTQSSDTLLAYSDASSPNTSILQYPNSSDSRLGSQQWYVPPKSSTQSIGSFGVFSEGSSPNTSNLQHPESLLKSLQFNEKWYLPAKASTQSMLSRGSERGESSPEHSLLSEQSVHRGVQRQRMTSPSTYSPTFLDSEVPDIRVFGKRFVSTALSESPESNESNGGDTRNESRGVFSSPSNKQKDETEDGRASPASLSSGSLVSDTSNRNSSLKSEGSTAEKSEEGKKSDEDAAERTGSEPGYKSTETETSKDGTGSESSNVEPIAEDNPSYTDVHLGTTTGSNTTALQEAFARRKQDFVKKSLARVERAKAKRFEVKPRVHIKKRVKPDKPAKPVMAEKSKMPHDQEIESRERSLKRKQKKS